MSEDERTTFARIIERQGNENTSLLQRCEKAENYGKAMDQNLSGEVRRGAEEHEARLKAEAACAEMAVILRDAKWICEHVVRMEDGGKNYIIPLAEFARKPLPENPGSALLTEVAALREVAKLVFDLKSEISKGRMKSPTAREWKEITDALDALPPTGKESHI